MTSKTMGLRLQGVEVSYGAIRALWGVSLEVSPGELVAILGPNGAGKTTLLAATLGLRPLSRGRILWADERIDSLPPWERARRGLGYVPEGGRVFPELTVEQNLYLGAYGRPKVELQQMLSFVSELFPILKERRRQLAGTLSGGERQMLAIARALMGQPKLLLVDEISMGLMPKLVREVFRTLAKLRDLGVSVLLAEQNAQEALRVIDRGYVLENGRIIFQGSAEELRREEHIQKAYLGL